MPVGPDPQSFPPRPDQTGEPRPPRAPAIWTTGADDAQTDPLSGAWDAETNPQRRPAAPDGQGPVLEWYRASCRNTYQVTVFAFGFMFAVMTLIASGLSWVSEWWCWLFPLLFSLVMFRSSRSQWMAAGSDWFASHTGWVKTYDLTKVELAGSGVSPSLYLTDTEGRAAHAELRRMQRNRLLWDLVYNGIMHSVHTREVTLNAAARAQVVELAETEQLLTQLEKARDEETGRGRKSQQDDL
ncbi:MAG: hypothetical protein ACRDSL_12290 [Pseudonocardiaceae bacterium]